MPKQIQDEFTSMPISRQRRYQLRQEARHRCRLCGDPAEDGLCPLHRMESRVHMQAVRAATGAATAPVEDMI